MHKPEIVLENETHKILWDFKIMKSQPEVQTWRLLKIKKRTCQLEDFTVPVDNRGKNKRKRNDIQIPGSRQKEQWIPIVLAAFRTAPGAWKRGWRNRRSKKKIETNQITALLK